MPPRRVLFVCYANYCRSPLAEGIFAHLVQQRGLHGQIEVDSAGVDALTGRAPHPHSVAAAERRGVALSGRARQLIRDDFFNFDDVLVMDRAVLREIQRLLTPSAFGPTPTMRARVRLFGELVHPSGRGPQLDVPDPVSGGPAGFDAVCELLWRGCERLLEQHRRDP
ncbi:MAG: low molecular weight phosphotyrosine protein phosphatase [Nannocystis sp.]|jgi:protein-tyrosine phosphatase|nr:low molecular weight phosphotyrosine protein phosphatase [Nannocystis sp.]